VTQLQCGIILPKNECGANLTPQKTLLILWNMVELASCCGVAFHYLGCLVKTEGKTNGEISRKLLQDNLDKLTLGRKFIISTGWIVADRQSNSRICGTIWDIQCTGDIWLTRTTVATSAKVTSLKVALKVPQMI